MSNDDATSQRAAQLDTATLSDALDRHGLDGQCYRIKPRSTDFRMTGRAWTLLYGPPARPPGTVGDYIDDVAARQRDRAGQRRARQRHRLGRHPHRDRARARASPAR